MTQTHGVVVLQCFLKSEVQYNPVFYCLYYFLPETHKALHKVPTFKNMHNVNHQNHVRKTQST